MRQHAFAFAAVVALAVVPARAMASSVWVVGPVFPDLDGQTAVALAQPGDLILFKGGARNIDGLVLTQAVSLVAEAGADVAMADLTIRDVPAGGAVSIRGLHLSAGGPFTSFPADSGLVVEHCDASVRVEDCRIDAGKWSASVQASASVVFSRCTLVGRDTQPDPFSPVPAPAGQALLIVDSTVRLESCDVRAGDNSAWAYVDELFGPGVDAGKPAVSLFGGELFVSGSTLTGGKGSDGAIAWFTNDCLTPPGGPGLSLHGAGSAARALDSSITAGPSGDPAAGCGTVPTSPDVVAGAGSFVQLSGHSNTLSSSAPAREGQTVTLTLEGVPGEAAFLLLAAAPADIALSKLQSVLLVDPAAPLLVFLGQLPASGLLGFSGGVPAVIPSLAWLPVYGQGLTVAPGDTGRLGAPTTLVLLDGGI